MGFLGGLLVRLVVLFEGLELEVWVLALEYVEISLSGYPGML
jgi:hypothetical protein